MENFWDFSVWSLILLFAVLLLSLLVANVLKRSIKILQKSLIPTSVLAGLILLVLSTLYEAIFGVSLFNTAIFGGKGTSTLEMITYHTLALGFIAATLKTSDKKMTKKRATEVFNSGVTTVSTYLLQAVLGLGITIVASFIIKDFFAAAGVLLPFGFGQGTGQALNFGGIYEEQGFVGGRSFGLTIAALGFLSASVGGVIHLHGMKKKGKLKFKPLDGGSVTTEEIESKNEIPMNGSIDKITVQIALIAVSYALSYLAMYGLSLLLPGMKATVYGFNFLFGALFAVAVKSVLNLLNNKRVVKRQYTNNFLLTRISNSCFDIMIVAGIAAIRLDVLKNYWVIIAILALVGLVSTYVYNLFIAKSLFPEYKDEQFMAMYGMLTGTASTGIMLLREIDGDFISPASDNLIYQQFPAIAFGFPLMLLANLAPSEPYLTFAILVAFFIVMNIILFRSKIFKKKKPLAEVPLGETAVTDKTDE